MSCGVGRRCGSDPALLWLWRRLSSDWTPSLETSICCGCGPKKKNKQTKRSEISFSLGWTSQDAENRHLNQNKEVESWDGLLCGGHCGCVPGSPMLHLLV